MPDPADMMPLGVLLDTYKPGSHDWAWDAEFVDLTTPETQKLADLRESIQREGMREPILLGDDGRVWDGHHRIVAALQLGLEIVPVEHGHTAPDPADTPLTRADAVATQALRNDAWEGHAEELTAADLTRISSVVLRAALPALAYALWALNLQEIQDGAPAARSEMAGMCRAFDLLNAWASEGDQQ